jgi:hypothetical protein
MEGACRGVGWLTPGYQYLPPENLHGVEFVIIRAFKQKGLTNADCHYDSHCGSHCSHDKKWKNDHQIYHIS